MEFRPRYSQPFTIQQAIGLDVSIINEEIARLQNSINRLEDTQNLLLEHVASEGHDAELATALSENDVVIASQQERISMLHFALREKGVLDNGHYAISSNLSRGHSTRPPLQVDWHAEASNEQGGVDL